MNDKKDTDIVNSLKTARGQIDGILKMIAEDRYCIDITRQIFAVQALLKKANMKILRNHIDHCVMNAVHDGKGDDKIDEIVYVLEKYICKV